MKQVLLLFAVVGVVLLAALISAVSCDKKTPDANKNTSSSGNGGNNSGGGTVTSPLILTGLDASISKVVSNTIYLKASGFPATVAGTVAEHFNDYNDTADTTRKKAFEIVIKDASGGMVIVADGDIASADKVTTAGGYPTDVTSDKGVHITVLNTAAIGTLPLGASIFSVFADKTAVTTATVDVKKSPFAFSANGGFDGTQPILWCVATITGYTADATTATMTGSQKTSCYIASVGLKAIGGAANAATATAWFGKTAPFKREIAVSVLGIRTDGTTLDKIGIPRTNPISALNDGLDATEMQSIVETAAKNGADTHVGFKTYTIKIVNDADFDAAK